MHSGNKHPVKEKAVEIAGRIFRDVRDWKCAFVAFAVYDAAVMCCFGAFCPTVLLTGLPCPGCGMTRAAWCVLTARWGLACIYNPCVFLWIGIGMYIGWNRYVLGREAHGAMKLAGGAAAVTILCHCLRMAWSFPGKPPLVYYEPCLLARIFPFYRQLLQNWFGGI